jgi:hypothetical protein
MERSNQDLKGATHDELGRGFQLSHTYDRGLSSELPAKSQDHVMSTTAQISPQLPSFA